MHLADPIFIFILALVLLGPKKTGELAQQLGKLMAEFRKASNDFKFQFNEEMRVAEQQDRQKKQDAERGALDSGSAAALPAPAQGAAEGLDSTSAQENSILPPAGDAAASEPQLGEAVPYAVSATTGEEHPVDDHPLLRVDVIPPMEGDPADQTAATAVTGREERHG